MEDLELDLAGMDAWFTHQQDLPFVLIRIPAEFSNRWNELLPRIVRRCYITDDVLLNGSRTSGLTLREVAATKLPDPGSVMSGDFGEIVAYLYQSVSASPMAAIGVKKWRLKQDRSKPAPYSDVVHFVTPNWPTAGPDDVLYCAEVKTKATAGQSTPIASALKDSEKDRTSRLAATLVWLRERAVTEPLGDVSLDLLKRFIELSEHPEPKRVFRAVAVLCSCVSDEELLTVPSTLPADSSLVVVVIDRLKETYMAVFEAVLQLAQ